MRLQPTAMKTAMSMRLRREPESAKGRFIAITHRNWSFLLPSLSTGMTDCSERFESIAKVKCEVAEHMALGLRQFVDFFVEYPDFYRVMMIEQPEVRLSVNLDMDAGYQHFLREITVAVKNDISDKRIKKVDPEFAAQIFLSLMKLIVERQLYSKGHSRAKDIKEAVEITLKGLER